MALDPNEYGYIVPATVYIPNRNGKPCTGGHVEFYITGTSSAGSKGTRYITYNNFDGSTNEFRIPIDMDGRITAIGSFSTRYDMYAYDSYGNMIFSRLNISAIGSGNGDGSGGITVDNIQIDSPYDTIEVSESTTSGVKTFHIDTKQHDGVVSWGEFGSNQFSHLTPTDTPLRWYKTTLEGERITWVQSGDDPNYGDIYLKAGRYHYDLAFKVVWDGTPRNEIINFQLGGFNFDERDIWIPFDMSYKHSEFYHMSGITTKMPGYDNYKESILLSTYGYGITLPEGMLAFVNFCTIHSIDEAGSIMAYDAGAMRKVYHNSTLTGDGTGTNPLAVNPDQVLPSYDSTDDKGKVLTINQHGNPSWNEVQVTDVQVDGTSVVSNGVANIDLSGYAHSSDIPSVPVKGVNVNGSSVVNAQGIANVTIPAVGYIDI